MKYNMAQLKKNCFYFAMKTSVVLGFLAYQYKTDFSLLKSFKQFCLCWTIYK